MGAGKGSLEGTRSPEIMAHVQKTSSIAGHQQIGLTLEEALREAALGIEAEETALRRPGFSLDHGNLNTS